jgi:putative GTP pyrophosphokinase
MEDLSMSTGVSKTQIDRLGERLKAGTLAEADLRLLDEYRLSFGPAYETVVTIVHVKLGFEPTGRPAKSTGSLKEKLRRESIRLVQVQDIAGCRVVVPDIAAQEKAISALRQEFERAAVVDRRVNPSFGYRAVHVIAGVAGKSVEIQLRTALQHSWAEMSEKLSDVLDPAVKYGGGPAEVRQALDAKFGVGRANRSRRGADG